MLTRLKKAFISPKQLKQLGVIGLNERNLSYISRYNQRQYYPLVDNKLSTKLLAQDFGINTPNLLAQVRHQAEIKQFSQAISQFQQGFVIKPANGSGGKGILVITQVTPEGFVKASGELLNLHQINHHLSNLLSGLYSLGGNPDIALIEALVTTAPNLAKYSYAGVPDIRVILYHGYPVMAMLRLSTKASDGKANLHQGALGVGIDLNSGAALKAVQFNQAVTHHPDTGLPVAEIQLENWTFLLGLAAKCYEMTRLGYMGADLVIDAEQGPLLLELNARPGLAIQMANGKGLKPRLLAIDNHLKSRKGIAEGYKKRVKLAQSL